MPLASEAEPLPTAQALEDRVMGDPNAPVTLVEYASLACHHCADFHKKTLPQIKERFIDTVRRIGVDPFRERVYAPAHQAA